jgi:hypothetical protein
MMPTDEVIAGLKSKHAGTLHLLQYDDGKSAVVAKQPPEAEWRRLVEASTSDKGGGRARALVTFTRSCIVWPDADALDAIFEERPALLERFGDALTDIAGAAEKITAKKL